MTFRIVLTLWILGDIVYALWILPDCFTVKNLKDNIQKMNDKVPVKVTCACVAVALIFTGLFWPYYMVQAFVVATINLITRKRRREK